MRSLVGRLMAPVVRAMSVGGSDRATPHTWVPPGHFYSPIPSLDDVRARHGEIFDRSVAALPGIELNERGQLGLLESFRAYYQDLPFTESQTPANRFYYENQYYSYGDAIVLYSVIRHLKPRRVIEVGSGFSSAVTLDTNEKYFGDEISCTFIDPYADRLRSLLRESDLRRIRLVEQPVQAVPLATFDELQANDILFIDSTHVTKTGSDVNYLLFQVLPRLRPGVCVHFHDVFYPFEYPDDWVYEGRAWNEDYILRAFLQYNVAFEIMFFSNYLALFHTEAIRNALPLFMKNCGGALWLRRSAA